MMLIQKLKYKLMADKQTRANDIEQYNQLVKKYNRACDVRDEKKRNITRHILLTPGIWFYRTCIIRVSYVTDTFGNHIRIDRPYYAFSYPCQYFTSQQCINRGCKLHEKNAEYFRAIDKCERLNARLENFWNEKYLAFANKQKSK